MRSEIVGVSGSGCLGRLEVVISSRWWGFLVGVLSVLVGCVGVLIVSYFLVSCG